MSCVLFRRCCSAPANLQPGARRQAATPACKFALQCRVFRAPALERQSCTARQLGTYLPAPSSLTSPQVGTKYFGRQPGEEELEDDVEEAAGSSDDELADAGALEDTSDSGAACCLSLCCCQVATMSGRDVAALCGHPS